jgi:hypothetical protein
MHVATVYGSIVDIIHGHVSWSKKTVVTQRGRDEGHMASTSSGSEKTDSPKDKDDGRVASTGPNPKKAGKGKRTSQRSESTKAKRVKGDQGDEESSEEDNVWQPCLTVTISGTWRLIAR